MGSGTIVIKQIFNFKLLVGKPSVGRSLMKDGVKHTIIMVDGNEVWTRLGSQ